MTNTQTETDNQAIISDIQTELEPIIDYIKAYIGTDLNEQKTARIGLNCSFKTFNTFFPKIEKDSLIKLFDKCADNNKETYTAIENIKTDNKETYTLIVDNGKPYEYEVVGKENLKKEIEKHKLATESEQYSYNDITILNRKGDDITEQAISEGVTQ